MTKTEEMEIKALGTEAYKMAEMLVHEYASKITVDDLETFHFLIYLITVRKIEIKKLEERINELEQKQKAHDNA